jgi:hypothetical protein
MVDSEGCLPCWTYEEVGMSKWTTVDYVEIRPGMMVFHYDWYWSRVSDKSWRDRGANLGREIDDPNFDGWFTVETWRDVGTPEGEWQRGTIYNGERMVTRCPNCRMQFLGCNEFGCGQRKEKFWAVPERLVNPAVMQP